MIFVFNNIWYIGKGRFCWEGKVNIFVVFIDLFCNEIELYYGYFVIWCYIGVVGDLIILRK